MRALVLALLLVPGAATTIVPQQGIAGVRLDMTQAQVRAVLGAPTKVKHGSSDFGPYTRFTYSRVTVMFQGNAKVTSVWTQSPAEKTARGAGVGSTEARVKAAVPAAVCKTQFGSRDCVVGKLVAGHRVTDFAISRGRVTRVTVGYVLD